MNLLLAFSEAHGHAEDAPSVWQSYLDLITDPAHLMLEATLILVIDVLLLGLAWPFIKRWVKRHDRIHHGHDHNLLPGRPTSRTIDAWTGYWPKQ